MRRGEELRQHILLKAKEVFLEVGFERASMDVIAARAETTKRSLYAHFENKERLFLAVIDMVRGLLRGKLKMPSDYSDDPIEALVLFCGQFEKILLWAPAVRICQLGITEAQRFPRMTTRVYEAIFGTAQKRGERFLRERFGLSQKQSARVAGELLGRVLYPRFTRALFGVEPVSEEWTDNKAIDNPADLALIRDAVAQLVPRRQKTAS